MAVHDNYFIINMVIQVSNTEKSSNYTYGFNYWIFKSGNLT